MIQLMRMMMMVKIMMKVSRMMKVSTRKTVMMVWRRMSQSLNR